MDKRFVPYNIALRLKEKDFDESCFASYRNSDGEELVIPTGPCKNSDVFIKTNSDNCAAPLYQEIQSWFEEKHKLELNATSWRKEGTKDIITWYYSVNLLGKPCTYKCIESDTRQEALTKAIEMALTKI